MIIALDYDETYTADPILWEAFVMMAKSRNHLVKFVTFRPRGMLNGDIEEDAKSLNIDIVYTEGRQKSEIFDADIWIDDFPCSIPTETELSSMALGCARMRGAHD